MFKQQCITLFQDKKFYKIMIVLVIPIIIQNLLVSSLNMVDTLMIGALGENEIAAVGIANQFFFLYNLVIVGVSAGCSMFISQYWGAKDVEDIHKTVGVGVISASIAALVFTLVALLFPRSVISLFTKDAYVIELSVQYLYVVCISYIFTAISVVFASALRSTGNARLPMIVSFLAILCNAFLNYIFIFGFGPIPAMGVKGAALATTIARILECIILLFFSLRKTSILYGTWSHYFVFTKAFFLKIQSSVIPVILNEGCWGMGTILYTMAYGQIGTKAIAATQITNTITNIFMVLCFSMSSAALVMIGNQIGAKNKENTIAYAYKFTILAFLLGILLGISMIFFAPSIISIFNVSTQVHNSSILILRIFSFMAPVRVLTVILIVGIFRGGGDAKFALKIEAFTMWFIGVPLAFLGAMYFHFDVEIVAAMVTIEEIVKLCICIPRLKSKKWIHDLTTA
ncbi:MAG: MATE family efflux transporter [Erysipelotrichaceae bacterium]